MHELQSCQMSCKAVPNFVPYKFQLCICSSKYPTPCLSFSDCIWEPGNVCKPPHVHTTFFQKSKHFLNTFLSSKTWTQIFRYSHDTKFMVFSLILYFPYSHLVCIAFHLSILNWAHYFKGMVLLKVTGSVDGHAKANWWSGTFGGPYKYNTWRYINFYGLPTYSMFICL